MREMGERALLIVNPGAGKRHAQDGDLAECVRLLTAAGFDIDLRETGMNGPTSAELAEAAIAEGFRIVFVAGGDGKARAYDEETGQVLWSGTLPGNSSGIPASYEANGRQYVVFSSVLCPAGRGGRGAAAVASGIAPDMPRGYIAFALPAREKTSPGIKH